MLPPELVRAGLWRGLSWASASRTARRAALERRMLVGTLGTGFGTAAGSAGLAAPSLMRTGFSPHSSSRW